MKVLRGLFGCRTEPEAEPPKTAPADTEPAVLRLAIGPVQTFIDQSRRTRDLWAGSFLLSWLAGQAMALVDADADATLVHPHVGGEVLDPLFAAILEAGARTQGVSPPRGPVLMPSLPNELRAEIRGVDHAAALADEAAAAVRRAWQAVAGAVFEAYVGPFLERCEQDQQARSRRIWERQIGTDPGKEPFWEIAWVAGPAGEDDGVWLPVRKLVRPLRTSVPEEGDLCTLMHDWQELSGLSRVTREGKKEQREFWENFRKHLANRFDQGQDAAGKLLELGESERLCAIALVRRLFPLLPVHRLAEVIGWTPKDADLDRPDRRQPYGYRPSTAAIATVHWLDKVKRHAAAKDVAVFVRAVRAVSHPLAVAEQHSPIDLIMGLGALGKVDGKLFYESTIENKRELPLADEKPRADLKAALKKLRETTDEDDKTLGAPSSYYALLRMDGDSVGALVGDYPELSAAIGAFGREVPALIEKHNALTIYAGGDDLMAMAPLEDALALAETLALAYRDHVQAKAPEATISAGLVFADVQAPLSGVLGESKRLLDQVAKEQNGRASLAASVYRIGGPAFTWATLFEAERMDGRQPLRPIGQLDTMLSTGDRTFRELASNRTVFNVRDRLGAFVTKPGAAWHEVLRNKEARAPQTPEKLALLLRAVAGDAMAGIERDRLNAFAELLPVRRRIKVRKRTMGDDGYRREPWMGGASFDALLLFRFLAAQWRKKTPEPEGRREAA